MLRQHRVIIENLAPQLQSGSFFIKRVVGETVTVTADVLPDGHDVIQVEILCRHEKDKNAATIHMRHLGNDVYSGSFKVDKQGFYEYSVRGWVDYALNWQHGIEAKIKDGQHVKSELLDGIQYLKYISKMAPASEKEQVLIWMREFEDEHAYESAVKTATSKKLCRMFIEHPQRLFANTSKILQVYVDRKKANFSTWYEFFPRSAASEPGKHGTFKDCERLLPRIAGMGFDTLYFPPIHPIGEKNRKGKNNATNAKEGDSGVP
ncbi:MAG: maltotransferase domain-containing protein [Flavobacteriales bacterium]